MFTSIDRRLVPVFVVAALSGPAVWADEAWNRAAAAAYLDQREQAWFEFRNASRGEGATQTTCVSCHTVVGYAFARPVLRRLVGSGQVSNIEQKLLADRKQRVDNWQDLDTPRFSLLYDFNERKKEESWGTEAVLNALLLGLNDRYEGQARSSATTQRALANLWQLQVRDGPHKGAWDWLDFNYEPWESAGARYFGASLAAIAVGTAPGYYSKGADNALDANVQLLRAYLKGQRAGQNLFNLAWALWASTLLDNVLTPGEQKEIAGQLLAQQGEDGGWSLSSLGTFKRRDNSKQETASDGYATGLVLHVLQLAGTSKNDARIAKGLAWLQSNQQASGAWRGYSLNKQRDHETHVGKFMSDAATAFAVLALSH